jgi:hypothetical protein
MSSCVSPGVYSSVHDASLPASGPASRRYIKWVVGFLLYEEFKKFAVQTRQAYEHFTRSHKLRSEDVTKLHCEAIGSFAGTK